MAKERSYSDSDLQQAIDTAASWNQVSMILGRGKASGSVLTSARKRARELSLDVKHLDGSASRIGAHHALVPTRTGSTNDKGHVAVAFVSAVLSAKGFVVVPALEGSRYDLLLEQPGGRFLRLQCKAGRLRRGIVEFHTRSLTGRAAAIKPKAYTRDDIDYFAVFCPENGAVYLLPLEDAVSRVVSLRIVPPANGQTFNVKWASTFEVAKISELFPSSDAARIRLDC